jgi:hypothetical protein
MALWPSIETLSQDVGVPYQTVHSWRRRNSIPAIYWDDVAKTAKKRGIPGITTDLLRKIYSARRN